MSVSTELTKVHPRKHLSAAHPGLSTVAVQVEDGFFVIEHSDGTAVIRNGHDLAASLSAKELSEADIRLWIDRPVEPVALARLRDILRELADWTGAVVWTPPVGGYCDIVPGCDDLAAVDVRGTTARWHYYQPGLSRPLRYSTDPDGRLIPAGGLVLQSCPSVPLISLPGPRLEGIAHRYAGLPPRQDSFMADLTVLEDGRPAACCADGSLFVLGPRSLARILNAHGWTGQPIVLPAELDATQQTGLGQYVRDINTALARSISIVATGLPSVRPPATPERIAARLTSMVEYLVEELPSLQQQFRTIAATDHARRVVSLDIWFRLLRCVAEARYSPTVLDVWAGRHPAPDDSADALRRGSALADARAAAREFVGSASLRPPMGSNPAPPYVDPRWDEEIRPSIALALNHLDPADPAQASQLRQLTRVLMALADASTVPPAYALDDARALIERAIVGASNAPEWSPDPESVPVPPSVPPTQPTRPVQPVRPVKPATLVEPARPIAPVQRVERVERVEPALPDHLPDAILDAPESDMDIPDEIVVPAPISEVRESDVDPHEEMFGPDPTRTGDWAAAAMFLARPRLEPTTRKSRPHGLSWLPDIVQANDDACDLFIGSSWSPERVAAEGFPSAACFLVGHLDAQNVGAAHSVLVRVEPQGAIDLLACGIEPPAELDLTFDTADAYILPPGWLDRCHIVLDGDNTDTDADRAGGSDRTPVLVRCRGASHGVDGLPEDVRWSARSWRGSTLAYAIVTDGKTATKGGLQLFRNKPEATAGRLVELRIGPGLAIDVAATEAKLKAFPAVRTILPELRAAGVDLHLPPSAFADVKVTGAFIADGHQWKPTGRARTSTLASLLESDPAEETLDAPAEVATGSPIVTLIGATHGRT